MSGKETFNILIADNDAVYTEILSRIVKPHNTLIANSGQEAVQMAREFVPDLILLEAAMPDISGFEVFDELKRHESTRRIPVIFITSLYNIEDEEKVLFLGAVDFITKPFHNPVISTKIRMHLQFIKQARIIEEQIAIDPLTDMPNRQGFNSRLFIEWARAVREKTPISILMVDLDKFADYNSTYGHPQSNLLIQTVAEIFKKSVKRTTDLTARLGGDKFAILLPNTGLSGAYKVAEFIRTNVENAAIPCLDKPDTHITVSIGINSITPGTADAHEDFVSTADAGLKTAKDMGRNTLYSNAQS